MSEGGGRIIEEDQTISINNPIAIQCWMRAKRWAGSISPQGVAAYSKWDAENAWQAGNAAFLRSWASDYTLVHVHEPPVGASQYGATSLPAGHSARVSTLGGNGLAVPKRSAHPREAIAMIRFLRRREVRMKRARNSSDLPKSLLLFELPQILHPYPQLIQSDQRGGRVVARPSVVAGQNYEAVSRAYIGHVHSVLSGEKSATVAAADLEKELIRITGFRPGPPPKPRW
jgi:trehalose/maltose transport system substrate-binding protein